MEITPEIQSTIAKGFALTAVMLLSGVLVRYFSIKVNYTRKINHFALFFLPVFIDKQFNAETFTDFIYLAISAVVATLALAVYYGPIRKAIPPFQESVENNNKTLGLLKNRISNLDPKNVETELEKFNYLLQL